MKLVSSLILPGLRNYSTLLSCIIRQGDAGEYTCRLHIRKASMGMSSRSPVLPNFSAHSLLHQGSPKCLPLSLGSEALFPLGFTTLCQQTERVSSERNSAGNVNIKHISRRNAFCKQTIDKPRFCSNRRINFRKCCGRRCSEPHYRPT